MTQYIVEGIGPITLTRAQFVGSGGQAQIFARDDVAFKVYDSTLGQPPEAKLAELRALTHPAIITPQHRLLDANGSTAVGYTMRFVREALPLCRLYTRSFREREGVTPEALFNLFLAAREALEALHKAGFLMVDVTAMNILTSRAFDEIFLIDADSFQTPSFPASAVTPSVLDPQAIVGNFTELTDWYAFAIVTFQLFIGIHPFKGKHPQISSMEERMRRNLSVLDPDVRIPRVCYPFDSIPGSLRSWYHALFVDGVRLPPPTSSSQPAALPFFALTSNPLPSHIDFIELLTASARIRSVFEIPGRRTVILTDDGIEVDGAIRSSNPPPNKAHIAFTNRNLRPVLAGKTTDGRLELEDIETGRAIPTELKVSELMAYQGRLYARSREHILELVLTELGTQIVASSRIAARCLEHATRLFDGVAIQNVLGRFAASLFPKACHSIQHLLPELDGYSILDARFDGCVLMVVAARADRFDRIVFRFDETLATYDCNTWRDCTAHDLNFVTLPSGICAHLDTDDTLVLFSAAPQTRSARSIVDDALHGGMRLVQYDGRVAFPRGRHLIAIRTRPANP